jgi:hypothetical protein
MTVASLIKKLQEFKPTDMVQVRAKVGVHGSSTSETHTVAEGDISIDLVKEGLVAIDISTKVLLLGWRSDREV